MIHDVQTYFWEDPQASYVNQDGEKRWQSVHGRSFSRYKKARKEVTEKNIVPIETIAAYINELLTALGIAEVPSPVMRPSEVDYAALKKEFELDCEQDIIWLKFTTDGFVGVVAASNDINFDIPPSASAYDNRVWKYNDHTKITELVWKYNSSGILVHKLNKTWDESLVLVFPLRRRKESCGYSRHEIEMAVGNYLIEKNVPIIDYYSHYIGEST